MLNQACLRRIAIAVVVLLCCSQRAWADQQILDDLIVVGSSCIGQDCVNGESFGFDTLRLKENNLRIRFLDTSSSASFPTQDWELTANESSNGGLNKFSITAIAPSSAIPFTIEAGAPSHSLYVDDGGRIGLTTSTPVVELHIVDGDSPTIRLEQDGSSGFTPQTWDIAGNETNFFVRDTTNGSRLPFRIRPSAPSQSLYIDTDGDVGLGTSSPDAGLEIQRTDGRAMILVDENNGTVANRQLLKLENNGAPQLEFLNSNASKNWRMAMDGNSNFIVDYVPSAGAEFFILQDTGGIRNNIGSNPVLIDDPQGLTVTGALTKGSGAFKIDHPLDPENQYLYHSFVESPDMMNIYNGNAKLDENGMATVTMPDWFEALNREFRYQLTAIGAAAPELHVAQQVTNGKFKIEGGKPGMEVSWQVTGVRQDPYAEQNRLAVEVEKAPHERGFYQHPEAYGQPETKGVGYARSAVASNE